jgi:hypothetical protein
MHRMSIPRYLFFALATVSIGCHSPTNPSDAITVQPNGHLSGMVTIGPNCPGPTTTAPCPAPPAAYALRKIVVYDEAKTELLHTVDIDSKGAFLVDLIPGRYTIDLRGAGIDKTSDLPKTVEIQANVTTTLNVDIDTGIR